MAELYQIYKCNKCGHVVEVFHAGAGTLVCCGEPMQLLEPKSQDIGSEKHVPIVEKTKTGVRVKVGSVPHPMDENHYIEWILLVAEGIAYRKCLKPGDKPEAEFCAKSTGMLIVRAYCNIHGLWKG